MKKKNTYIATLVAIFSIVLVGYLANISIIKTLSANTLQMLSNPFVYASAAICAFIFMSAKHYWIINIGCAIIASIIIQFVILGSGAGLIILSARALAFILVVFTLNLIKIMFTR